jgi:hypothetical protein
MMDNDNVCSCRPWAWTIRAAYIVVNVGLLFVRNLPIAAACHVLLMGAVGSLHLAMHFVLSHNFTGAERHSNLQQQQQLHRADDNLVHLVAETSCPYGAPVAGWLTGGLNYMYQIDHHLFPGSAAFTTRLSHRSCARQRSNTV